MKDYWDDDWGVGIKDYYVRRNGALEKCSWQQWYLAERGQKGCTYHDYGHGQAVVAFPKDKYPSFEKPKKLARLSEIDPWCLEQLARVAGHGSNKYGQRLDYLITHYDWSVGYDANQRHLMKFWQGEDIDPDSGEDQTYHLASAAWRSLQLLSWSHHNHGTDDRYKK